MQTGIDRRDFYTNIAIVEKITLEGILTNNERKESLSKNKNKKILDK